ncbi:MAG: MATE family efflux transporter [Sulfurimonas sp.]|nr:MATE family efflux transporter [Sulfurimonas sp.]
MRRNKIYFFKETTFNYLYQFIYLFVNFMLVPISINYLGNVKYGAWVLVLSIISWVSIANFGLGNGLRNKIAENYNISDKTVVMEYVSTTFYSVGLISIFILLLFGLPLLFTNDFSWLLPNQDIDLSHEIKISLLIVFFGFCISFTLGVYKSIAYGLQKSSWVGESQAMNAIFLLLFIAVLLKFFDNKLIYISYAYVVASLFSNIFTILRVIKYDYAFIPKLNMFNIQKLKSILNLGFGFFILQICMIIIFSTDNILITKLLGLQSVTEYTILDKVFTTGNVLFSTLLVALWSGITKAYAEKNYKWIKTIIKKLHFIFIIFTIGTIIVGIYFNNIAELWIGKNMDYSYQIIFIFVIYTLLSSYGGIFVNIMNGLGKIKLQIYLMIFAAIINIPLSIIFVKYFHLGIEGIKLGTLVSLLLVWIFIPLQVFRLIYLDKKENNNE